MSISDSSDKRTLDRSYLEKSRSVGYSQTIFVVLLFVAALILSAKATQLWHFLILFFVMGCIQHKIFFPIHDCIHYSLFTTKTENVVVGTLLSPLIGTSFDAIRTQHMDHHRDFGSLEDPGASDYFVRFKSRSDFLRFLLGPLAGSIVFEKFSSYLSRPSAAVSRNDEEWPFTRKLKPYALIMIIQFMIATIITSGGTYTELWRYPALYILPLFTVFLFFNRLRMFAEHGSLNYEVCDYLEGKRPTARTIYASKTERILICGSDFNYHHEHHKYPMVPGFQLPSLHESFAGRLNPEDVRPTYMGALRELWRNLP